MFKLPKSDTKPPQNWFEIVRTDIPLDKTNKEEFTLVLPAYIDFTLCFIGPRYFPLRSIFLTVVLVT